MIAKRTRAAKAVKIEDRPIKSPQQSKVDIDKLVRDYLAVTDSKPGEFVKATLINPEQGYYRVNWWCIAEDGHRIVRSGVYQFLEIRNGHPALTQIL